MPIFIAANLKIKFILDILLLFISNLSVLASTQNPAPVSALTNNLIRQFIQAYINNHC